MSLTLFNPINFNNSNEFVFENSKAQVDQNLDLPIALRKGTKAFTHNLYLSYPLKKFHLHIEPFSQIETLKSTLSFVS